MILAISTHTEYPLLWTFLFRNKKKKSYIMEGKLLQQEPGLLKTMAMLIAVELCLLFFDRPLAFSPTVF